jgi:hypothetical protein
MTKLTRYTTFKKLKQSTQSSSKEKSKLSTNVVAFKAFIQLLKKSKLKNVKSLE